MLQFLMLCSLSSDDGELGSQDSNLDVELQRLLCCRYTTPHLNPHRSLWAPFAIHLHRVIARLVHAEPARLLFFGAFGVIRLEDSSLQVLPEFHRNGMRNIPVGLRLE